MMRRLLAVAASLVLALASPARAADPAKTLRVAFQIAETSFDPAFASDAASDAVISNIFDAMLDYDYLARPVRLVPRALEAMPVVEEGGKIVPVPDPQGDPFHARPARSRANPRELTAADFAYGFKRILDPAVKSPWLWLLEGKLVGGDELRKARRADRPLRLRRAVAGPHRRRPVHAAHPPDAPDLRFPYVLAVPNLAAQAREVVDAYGLDIGAHPVGTGPYMLGEYRRSARIVLVANPGSATSRTCRRARFPRRRSRSRRAQGPEAAAGRSRRDPRDRGRAGALAGVPQQGARLSGHPAGRVHRRGTRQRQAPARASRRRGSSTTRCCARTRGGRTST